MTRLVSMILGLAMFCAALCAQNIPTTPEAKPVADDVRALETKADLTEFIKKYLPGVDPGGAHDFTKIENPSDPAKRYAYTHAMSALLMFYVNNLDMGPTMAAHFDQLARTALKNQAVFNALYARLLMAYPRHRPNLVEAESCLRAAIKLADNYEYAHYLLAVMMYSRAANASDMLAPLDRALKLKPDFTGALLLKTAVLLNIPGANQAEAGKLVDQLIATDHTEVEDFVQVLQLFEQIRGAAATVAKIDEMRKGGKLRGRHRAHACGFAAETVMRQGKPEDALAWLEDGLASIKVGEDPRFYMIARQRMGKTNGDLAEEVRRSNPRLEGEALRRYQLYVDAARKNFLQAATIEQEQMPADMRGEHAGIYVVFLDSVLQEAETAVRWLAEYLEKTTLNSDRRARLEALLLELRARTTGDERELARQLRSLREKADTPALQRTLMQCLMRTRQGQPLRSAEVLHELLAQFSYADRDVVVLSAQLATAAARQRGGDDIPLCAKAIATRLEQEPECINDEQSQLQKRLVDALKTLELRDCEARAARHLKKLLDAVKDDRVTDPLNNVLIEWLDDDWRKNLGAGTPDKPRRTLLRSAKHAAQYLEDLAVHLDKLAKEAK